MAKPAKERGTKKSGAKRRRKVPKEAQAASSTKGPASSNSNSQASTPPGPPGQPLTPKERTRYDQLKPKYVKSPAGLKERMEQFQVVIQNSKGREKRAAEEEHRRLEAEFKAALGDPQARMSKTEQKEFYGLRKKLRHHEILERDRGEKECLSSAPKEPSPAEIRAHKMDALEAEEDSPELLDPRILIGKLRKAIKGIFAGWIDRDQGLIPTRPPWSIVYGDYYRLTTDLMKWLKIKRPGMDLMELSNDLKSFGHLAAWCPPLNAADPELTRLSRRYRKLRERCERLKYGPEKLSAHRKLVQLLGKLDVVTAHLPEDRRVVMRG